jgi:arylsulfatase A-like enzyme
LALVAAAFIFIFKPEVFNLVLPERWHLDAGLFGDVKPIDVFYAIKDAVVQNPGHTGFWLAFACVVKLLGITSGVIRWKLLLHGQGIKIPLLYMVYLWFMGRAIGLFLPGTLGLDGFRLVESSRYTGEWIKCTTVIAVEKIIGFIALSTILMVAFPMGAHLVGVSYAMVPIILLIPFGVFAVFMLLLLNPRVIQVGMAALPTPGFIRRPFNKLGVAATTYSGRKITLLLAVFFGMLVHTGTILMYFGCRMALGVTQITPQEVLFASSLIIGLSVLTPTISGLGVREFVGATVLGAKVSPALGIGMAHLGLWGGEVVPYLLSVPLLLLGGRPSREKLEAGLAELRARTGGAPEVDLHLTPQDVSFYRRQVFGTLFCGVFAGALVGLLVGLAESGWLLYTAGAYEAFVANGAWSLAAVRDAIGAGGFAETGMFWWGALAYGLLFAGLGFGIACGFLFLFLLVDRFPAWQIVFGMVAGVAAGFGALVFGLWRYKRDVLGEGKIASDFMMIAGQSTVGLVLEVFLAAALLALAAGWLARHKPVFIVLLGVAVLGAGVAGTFALSRITQPPARQVVFSPPVQAQGPNILFVTIDALRADFLRMYKDTPGHDRMDELEVIALDSAHGGAAASVGNAVIEAQPESIPVAASNTAVLTTAPTAIMSSEQMAQLEALGYLESGSMSPSTAPQAVSGSMLSRFTAFDRLPEGWTSTPQPLNPYRAPSVTLPHLEGFLQDAVLFEYGFAQASWTKPSFATMFTGLYPEEHGAYTKMASLPPEVTTMAEALRDAGYYTMGMPNNPNTRAYFGFDQGHLEYIDLEPRLVLGATPSASRLTIYEIARRVMGIVEGKILRRPLQVRDFYQPAEEVTDVFVDWLEQNRTGGAPWYAYVHYMDPHDPFMDPDAPGGGYARRDMPNPSPALDKAMEDAYISDVVHMDVHIGRLFDTLKARGLYDNTLIVVVSDHGEEFCDHGGWWHGQTLYDELIHVPYMIKLPGNAQGGTRNPHIARHVDLMPTMLQAAGAPIPEAVRGIPLFDAAGNAANSGITESFAHNELESNLAVSVRTRDLKLIYMNEGEKYYRNMPPVELYHLLENPLEAWADNLAASPAHGSVLEELRGKLEGHFSEVVAGEEDQAAAATAPGDAAAPMSGQQLEQLEALGYLE